MKQPRKLQNTYLSESIKNIDRLSESVRQHLGIDPMRHNLFVLPRQQEITLLVDSPVFASQLRYQKNDILRFINTHFLSEFKRIQVKISPPIMTVSPPKTITKTLPKGVAEMLSNIRNELES